MDLRISVAVLLIFLSGGYSLKCYSCLFDTGSCEVDTCGDGFSKCKSMTAEAIPKHSGSGKVSIKTKHCAKTCEPGTQMDQTGKTVTTYCCDTDFCNAADGVYKGPFLLLLSLLFFYFLFH